MSTKIPIHHIDDLIQRNLKSFSKPGALTVRPGYEISNGWVTGKQAIVVTVDKKSDDVPKDHLLPQSVGNIPVDVREATGLQRLRAKSHSTFDLAKFHMRGEIREPDWQFERSLPSGTVLPPNSATSKPLGLQSKTAKTQVPYTAPAGVGLDAFVGNTTIIACASPDAGYDMLKDFLSKTKSELTIAMYDFTSADLLNDVTDIIKDGKKFKMVLDHPMKNPTADQTDTVTREKLLAADSNALINWALTRNDPVVNKWVYPSAYHIKVVVRDGENGGNGKAMWLSSGNFNNSNEPNHSTTSPHKGADRDWHVVVLNDQLASVYKAFIEHDFDVAGTAQGVGDEIQHHLISSALDDLKAESAKSALPQRQATDTTPSSNFQKQIFTDVPVKIQPLLTPDKEADGTTMYVNNVLKLINSATAKLYIQTQYIHPSTAPGDVEFMKIISALQAAKKKGLDVRVILSEFENTSQWIEKMQELDLVEGILKLQNNVHNKGIVVDSKVVMVSSENWSSDGVLRNRDAGLIIDNADIAQYFEKIFLFDWQNKANIKIVADAPAPAQ